jgi:AbrB family looped-hinge helix DNA binding protein
MELVKLGKKGQVTIPKSILRSIGIPDEAPLLVETTPDGAIVLRQAAVYPIELYTEEQLAEYEESNTVPPALERRVEALAARRSRKK